MSKGYRGDPYQQYQFREVIDEDREGKLYRAVHSNKKQYAIKVINIGFIEQNKKVEQRIVNQLNIIEKVQKSDHIIKYYDMFKTLNNFYFIYQYCNGGSLQEKLKKQQRMHEKNALFIIKQLLETFRILHRQNIVYKDLKPHNIAFHDGVTKLNKFGYCQILKQDSVNQNNANPVFSIYTAPQIINKQNYTTKADIWSIGIVLYEMLYGCFHYKLGQALKYKDNVLQHKLDFPSEIPISTNTKTLVKRMLTRDPKMRISWDELFQMQISKQGQLISQQTKHQSEKTKINA